MQKVYLGLKTWYYYIHMSQIICIDNIKKRKNYRHIRRVVTLPDGREHRLDKTLGSCDTVYKLQAMKKAMKLVQKVKELGLDALKMFERSILLVLSITKCPWVLL